MGTRSKALTRAARLQRSAVCCFALVFAGCGSGVRTDAAAPITVVQDPVAPTPAPAPAPTTFSADLNASSIFIGASIIHGWALPMHNAGISGQTTAQILQRFQADVTGHGYARVIIQAGTNDILQQVKDPSGTIAANLASMGQIATSAGMEVVLISLGPITNGVNLDAAAADANAQISQLAARQGYIYVDIFTPMQGHPEYFLDGFHPNTLGYTVIEKSLSQLVTK